ncbi:ABC transporter ATP-binding protein [uncultured Desulfuromusa sp.]|uniref:ABC transporter ATP-binding protein n=1 Tax=uncultured Desulfuromusa sp. TaxID=219183 RepID=UPI002AA955F7|nr:ABC transporter ATP-binding protein [uncultured Desulfuromusa sp.]
MTDSVIKIENISKTFKEGFRGRKVMALKNLSLEVFPGEIFGFLGPNGAGKSTTIKSLLRLIRPDSGQVSVLGEDVRNSAIRKRVGYLPENPYFYDCLTAEELLWFGGKTCGLDSQEIIERTDLLLSQVGLDGARKRYLRTYSKGMVQRAGLALSLIHEPSVIILDEPMSGLDPLGRKMVVDLILGLKKAGKTVFFSSHILNDIERLCDRVGVIAQGQLRAEGELSELLHDGETLEEFFLHVVAGIDVGGC